MIYKLIQELRDESSTTKKNKILNDFSKNKESELLKKILYLTYSNRVNLYTSLNPFRDTLNESSLTLNYSLNDCIEKLETLLEKKLRGYSNTDFINDILRNTSNENKEILSLVIDRNLRCGLSTSTINKVYKGLIEKEAYMGCKPYSSKLIDKLFEENDEVILQIKEDGFFDNINFVDKTIKTRQGESFNLSSLKMFKDVLDNDIDVVMQGEFLFKGFTNRSKANGIFKAISHINNIENDIERNKYIEKFNKKNLKEYGLDFEYFNNNAIFVTWDFLTTSQYSIDSNIKVRSNEFYKNRLSKLEYYLDYINSDFINLVETKFVKDKSEVGEFFNESLQRGLEGVVAKSPKGIWKDGKHNFQVKLKKEISLDLRIKSYNYGEKGSKNEHVISSINVKCEDGLLKTSPCGMSEDIMNYVTENQDKLMNTIVEVTCNGVSKNSNGVYSVLHPRITEFRFDKDVANTLDECLEIDCDYQF